MDGEFIVYIIFCILLGIGITIYGFSRGVNDFFPNFLAGWGQFFVELVVCSLLIDKFTDRQHNKRWAKVRHIHYRTIKECLIKILNTLCLKFNYVDISKSLLYKKKGFNDISPVVDNLIKELNYMDNQDDTTHKQQFIEFYDEVRDKIKETRTMFIPQIIQNTDNQELADLLSELDLLFIKFEDEVLRCRHKDSANFDVDKIVKLIELINEVLIRLSKEV